jgi:hypothetical protein
VTQDPLLIRQVPLLKLESCCQALTEVLHQSGLSPEASLEAWRAAVSAECVRCGIPISGEELFALSQPPSAERASAKIGRMRLGDCARQGCNSYDYRVVFRSHAQLDWPKLLAQAEELQQEKAKPPSAGFGWKEMGRLWVRQCVACRRLWIPLSILVLLLLLWRQWYVGGRIPLLREPEHFRVDPAPQAESQE